jgi:hypothetical protein
MGDAVRADFPARSGEHAQSVEVRQRLLDLASNRAALEASVEAVSASTEAQRVVGERFAAGVATSTDNIYAIAGTGSSANTGDGGQATEAQIDQPRSMDLTSAGGYVWAQPWSNRVRIVGPDGNVSTLAGTGVAGYSGDGGPATAAQLNFVHGAAQLTDGSFVLADTINSVIRKVSTSGVISTVVGDGNAGYSGDGGPAASAEINNPRGLAAMPDGGFVFPDSNNHRVRRVWPNGTITTVAGTGVQGFAGDGGPATSALLSIPFGVSPTADGWLPACRSATPTRGSYSIQP